MKQMPLLLLLVLSLPLSAAAEDVFRIEIGKGNYSKKELQKRVWHLERAVWQLQQKVFQLENASTQKPVNTWVCTIDAMSDQFSASGPSKAVAKNKVIKKCNKKRGSGFFCKKVKCEQ